MLNTDNVAWDGPTDLLMDGRIDEHDLLLRSIVASKNGVEIKLKEHPLFNSLSRFLRSWRQRFVRPSARHFASKPPENFGLKGVLSA